MKKIERKANQQLYYDQEKQNCSHSDIQSLLMSSTCQENQANYINLQNNLSNLDRQSKLNKSMIKRQHTKNIFIQDYSDQNKSKNNICGCSKQIKSINQSIQFILIKIEEIESKIEISFSKHIQNSSKLQEQQKIYEEVKFLGWESKQILKQIQTKIEDQKQKDTIRVNKIESQMALIINKMNLFDMKRQNDRICQESRRIEQRLERFKSQTNQKINQVVETLQEMGKLQRKVIEKKLAIQYKKMTYPDEEEPKQRSRCFSVANKNYEKYDRNNESTNISFSRNYEYMK